MERDIARKIEEKIDEIISIIEKGKTGRCASLNHATCTMYVDSRMIQRYSYSVHPSACLGIPALGTQACFFALCANTVVLPCGKLDDSDID
jgi:hypothetical protein